MKLARIVRRVEELLDAQSGASAKFTAAGIILEEPGNRFGHGVDVSLGNDVSGDSIRDGIRHATVVRDNRRDPHGHGLEAGPRQSFRKGGRAVHEDIEAVQRAERPPPARG